jgi:putative MATE family efflux protein
MNKNKNFTEGPLFFRITLFALPILLTGLLQIAYGMADNIVVGKFSGDNLALAAVGCTGTLSNLIINLLMGVAGGTGIIVSQCFGAKDSKKVSECVHTSLAFSVIGGIVFALIGLLVSRPALILIGTKPEVLDRAVLYIRIICLGIPANSVYNFGASILRATGNSRAPLVILGTSGLCNVLLNIFFVIVLHMTVDGVALATIASQYISAVAVVAILAAKKNESYCFRFSELKIDKTMLTRILRVGIPVGVQGVVFSIANIIVTASLNTFPTVVVSANTISGNIDAITWTVINSFGVALMTFVGQNCGAKKPDRVKKSVNYAMLQTVIVTLAVASVEFLLLDQMIGLYLNEADPCKDDIIKYAKTIVSIMLGTYVIFSVSNTMCAGISGLGHSFKSLMVNMICICGLRVVWILTAVPFMNSIETLIAGYPISWVVGGTVSVIVYFKTFRKFKEGCEAELCVNESENALAENQL